MSLASFGRTALFGVAIASATVSIALISWWAANAFGPLFRDAVWAAAFLAAAVLGRPAMLACWDWACDGESPPEKT